MCLLYNQIQMSNVNTNQPFQLIRFKQGKFEVPVQTAAFLRQIKNPLGIITIVGKYRTGKSLFLNKVLLRKTTFKVSPTINSCTKGLWMCRQTLKAQNAEDTDILVVDTQGFGATQQSEQYNNRILLFSMLLSSYFIYNSVGSIDQNSLNSLNLVAQLARELLKNNSKDQKIDDQSPAFLWLVRDFALNLVDKNGNSIQPRQYLQQALQIQKGTSDAIQNKNKIRRMIKHFFKDRDCFTMVRPVQSEQNLQNLLYLADSCLRPQFLQQVQQLRSKILRKVRAKRIKNRTLDGQALLQLAYNYVEIINRGDLPNFQLTYKHIMRFQIQRAYRQFVDCCKKKISQQGGKMLSKSNIQNMQLELQKQLENRFREGLFQAQQTKLSLQKGKNEMVELIEDLKHKNHKRCLQNVEKTWLYIYDSEKSFDSSIQINQYFNHILQDFSNHMKEENNPIDQNYIKNIIFQQKDKKTQQFLLKIQNQGNREIEDKNSKINQLSLLCNSQKKQIHNLEEHVSKLSRQVQKLNGRCTQIQNLKNMEIQYLKQKQSQNNQEISQLTFKYQQTNNNLDGCRAALLQTQMKNEQLSRMIRQVSQGKRLVEKELSIIHHNLDSRSQELNYVKNQLSQTSARLQNALQKQLLNQAKYQTQIQYKNQQHNSLLRKSETQIQLISKLNLEVQRLTIQFQNNSNLMIRQKSIYENMFQSFKQSLRLEGTSRVQLIQTNKNLSSALKHLQKRAENAQEKQKQLKQYKKCIKNASCLQCQHCTKFFVPSIFIPHLNVCLIGPQALKCTKLQLKSDNRPKMEIKIKQTLVKQSQGKPFTEYVIELKRDKKEWSVNRKYKSFCDLNSALRAALPGVQLSQAAYIVNPHQLSKKSLVIEQRRRILQKYLNDLQANPLVSVTNLWKDFIEEPEELSISQSLRNSPLKQNNKGLNQQQTPQQFFKIWNQRKIRSKQSSIGIMKKGKAV